MIVPLSLEYVDQIAQLHCCTLTGLLSELGLPIVRAYYIGCIRSKAATGFVDIQDGTVRGFVLGSIHPDKLKQMVVRYNPVGLLIGVLLRPASLVQLLGSFRGPDKGNYDPFVPELTYLAVSDKHQAKGIGKSLVEMFTQEMRKLGVSVFELSVDEDNNQGVSFYEKQGFCLVGSYCEFGILHLRYRLQLDLCGCDMKMTNSCPLCQSQSTYVRYDLTDYTIAQCRECEFIFNQSFPLGESAKRLFSQSYYTDVQKEAFERQAQAFEKDPSLEIYQLGLERMEALSDKGAVLDVGVGFGSFLHLAKMRGWTASGVEISSYGTQQARAHGLDVKEGTLRSFSWEPESFDAVTFWDSIEHVESPREDLEQAFRLLKKGGLLLVTTDDYHCLMAWLARLLHTLTAGRLSYGVRRLYIPYNRSYFTAARFRQLIKDIGFDEIAFKKIEYPLQKIKANLLERSILALFYALAAVTHQQAQFLMICRKPER